MNGADSETGPVFVVGMNGSGTTMLLECLGRHPALYAFPRETRLIPHLIASLGRYGDLRVDANFRRLWDDVRQLAAFRLVNGGDPVALPAAWHDTPRSLAGVLDGVFGSFAARVGKRRWCEKTPQHIQHLPSLAEQFPTARFVHVIRDGRDCAVSFHRRWLRQPELTIYRWKKVVSKGRADGARLGAGRYLEIRYEDLTAEPERSLRRICAFLGLPFDDAVLESAQPYLERQADSGGTGLRANSGKWRDYFPARTARRLEQIAGHTLADCGYATDAPLGDADVPGWQRRYWSASESLRQYGREIWLKSTGKLARPWSEILAKPLNALRQRRHNEY